MLGQSCRQAVNGGIDARCRRPPIGILATCGQTVFEIAQVNHQSLDDGSEMALVVSGAERGRLGCGDHDEFPCVGCISDKACDRFSCA